jgi:hypothetical protein
VQPTRDNGLSEDDTSELGEAASPYGKPHRDTRRYGATWRGAASGSVVKVRGPCPAASGNSTASPDSWEDAGVYVALTRVDTGDQPVENATIVGEEMYRWFRETEGFEGLLLLSTEGTTLGLTFWQNQEIAERHRVARLQFRDRITAAAGVQVEETVDYEVTFARLGELAEPKN